MKDRGGLYLVVGVVAISLIALVVPAPPIVASDPATAAPKTQAAEKKIPLQGVFRGAGGCELPGKFSPLTQRDQKIKILVNPGLGNGSPKYQVNTEPTCARIHQRGSLTFEIFVSGRVHDWDFDNNTFDLDFSVPQTSDPKVKGPYKPDAGKKRGRYENHKRILVIPAGKMDSTVPVEWICSYSLDLHDKDKIWIGGVDPGVMVVDNP